jgi:hypothetical protein
MLNRYAKHIREMSLLGILPRISGATRRAHPDRATKARLLPEPAAFGLCFCHHGKPPKIGGGSEILRGPRVDQADLRWSP